ncbi:OB-fold domain-containing protein [Streptomyces sp. NPDC056723]|uniref:OB-fold domain-containing protein n=1 Tax=unclassified Streptomyces TaxID=2593676 RepID=UPI0036A6B8C6
MTGIIGYHSYVPQYRLRRSDIAAALGADAHGERAVASYDEDSTTLGVAAALPVVHGRETDARSLWFATSDPVYVDKTNATTVHAALDLSPHTAAVDLGASLRSGAAALLAAARDGGLAVLADRRGGAVGGADERTGGDAAAAFLFGDDATVARITNTAAVTAEFIDRWRAPGTTDAGTWEERFGEQRYAELAEQVLAALTEQGVDLAGVARFAVAGINARAVRTVGNAVRRRTGAQQQGVDLADLIGNAGTAQIGLVLADLLDVAEPGEKLLLVSLADGADAIILRAADTIVDARPRPLRDALGVGAVINYPQYLLWRRRIVGERPRRPDPDRPSAPFAWRNRRYKLSMIGGRCRTCGAVQYPLPEVCYRCRTADGFDPVPAGDRAARIVTFTVDRLAFSPSPPLVSAIVAFEDGGRLQCELTDVRGPLDVGDEVVPTFRRGATVDGIHNYVWKMRPRNAAAQNES